MNDDAEAMQQFVVWLLQTLDPADYEPSGDWNQAAEPEQTGSVNLQTNLQSSAELLSSAGEAGIIENVPDQANQPDQAGQPIANPQDLSMPLDEEPSPLAFGDIPAVQHRFHALLKHRLKLEIERNPPRFPWETEQQDDQYDYQYDYESYAGAEHYGDEGQLSLPVPEAAPLWAAQLKTLNLPIAMPDGILQTLFEQCRQLVQSSLREGRRLVQATEALFPEEGAVLNNLAGMVLASPVRSGTASLSQPVAAPSNLPQDYSQASRPQQMVLSLLAARQMFEAMTLALSPNLPTIDRVWLTDAGSLTIKAQYSAESGRVEIGVQLPTGGKVRFQQAALESIASCNHAGSLSVSLCPFAAEQPAMLTLELDEADSPLAFAVRLTLEP